MRSRVVLPEPFAPRSMHHCPPAKLKFSGRFKAQVRRANLRPSTSKSVLSFIATLCLMGMLEYEVPTQFVLQNLFCRICPAQIVSPRLSFKVSCPSPLPKSHAEVSCQSLMSCSLQCQHPLTMQYNYNLPKSIMGNLMETLMENLLETLR